ncbi:HGGxSTG domain-containing protein [Thermomonas beijingensis]|uniref:HGGxSTG domain-containing protein n=1 Tax=Thermomonas beijingensis TaxID=2872701 RepID=UPI003CCD9C6B
MRSTPPVTSNARRCGADTRAGRPCRCKPEPGKTRCRNHGGCSTGPKTPEGKARSAQNRRAKSIPD